MSRPLAPLLATRIDAPGTDAFLTSTSCSTALACVAVSDDGALQTTDGGHTWTKVRWPRALERSRFDPVDVTCSPTTRLSVELDLACTLEHVAVTLLHLTG